MSRPMELYRQWETTHYLNRRENTGVRQQREDEAKAEAASEKLRVATIRAIMAHADRAGTDVDTAARFLLSGRRLARTVKEADGPVLAQHAKEEAELLGRLLGEASAPERLRERQGG